MRSRFIRRQWVFAIALAASGVTAHGQERLEFHSCTGSIGGGIGSAHGEASQGFREPGWAVQAGGGFAMSNRLAFIADFLLQDNGISKDVLKPPATAGHARIYTVMLEPTWIAAANRRANFYVLGGFGWLRRSIKLTGDPVNPTDVTNPADRPRSGGSSLNSGAFDVGAGANLRLGRSNARLFLEARYVHGLAANSRSTLAPITAGLRW